MIRPAIRLGTGEDAARISDFALDVFVTTFGPDNRPEDMVAYAATAFTPETQAREIDDPSRLYLLADSDGSVAAYALLRVGSTDPSVTGARPVEIERFYVGAAHHGTGIAQLLMDAVIDTAVSRGGETLWLGVWERNPRAIRFYEKHGFTDVGAHPFTLGTDVQTDRVMSRPLARPGGAMVVELEKRRDGDTVMRCTRTDGSSTFQRHAGPRAVFFAYHDLSHFAVERTLGTTDGFFGLIAAGWDVGDTEGSGARGPIPARAIEIENLVGLFDRERAGGVHWSADEFNDAAAMYASERGAAAPQQVTTDQVDAIRAEIDALHRTWRALPAGDTLRLVFAASSVSASSPGSSRGR